MKSAWVVAAALAVGGCARDVDPRVERLLGTFQAGQAADAEVVEAWITGTTDPSGVGLNAVQLDAAGVAEAKALFLAADSYDWSITSATPEDPRLVLVFSRDGSSSDCCQVTANLGDAGVVACRDGTGREGSLRPARGRLLALARRTFPGDADLQAMK